VNPFEEWKDVTLCETIVHWLARLKGNGIPYDQKVCIEQLVAIEASYIIANNMVPAFTHRNWKSHYLSRHQTIV
jgi:hypothetical protein